MRYSAEIQHSVGLPTVLFLIFLVLKLCHVIDWSWWWITAPLWMIPVILLSIFLIIACIAGMTFLFNVSWNFIKNRFYKK